MKRHRSGCLPTSSKKRFQTSGCDPVSREDLVINKNRLNDISDWMDSLIYKKIVPPLLLCGPAGCGKSACIRVLAAEKSIEIVEWSTPVDRNAYLNSDDPEWMGPVRVSNAFKDFLLSVGRCVSIDGDSTTRSKKLIVVKDFPTSFFNNPEEFRDIIENYLSKSLVPLVFICTDSPNKKSKDIAYELFTEDFKAKQNIVQMSLLPVPVTSVVKALKRVVQRGALCLNDDSLKEIAQDCRGDIRKALNDLKLQSVDSGRGSKNGQRMKKKGEKDKKKSSNNDDESSGLFHTVGRILYAKRVPDGDTNITGGELVHKPEDIVKQFSHYANQVVSLAHSNYLDIFSSIDSIAKASAYLSDADIIMSEWREKDLLTCVGFSVAVGGFMNSNRDPVRRFRPIHGSKWNEDMKVAGANLIQMHNVFSDYCISKANISLEVVPFLTKMWEATSQDPRTVKLCPHGFLPHRTDLMFTALTKIKSDVLNYSLSFPVSHCNDDFDDDPPLHISDDSD